MLSYAKHWRLSCATENVDKFVRFFLFSIVRMVFDKNISWTGLVFNAECESSVGCQIWSVFSPRNSEIQVMKAE